MSVRKMGVEEELLVVDPATGRLTALAAEAVRRHDQPGQTQEDGPVEEELYLQQIETMTEACTSLDDLVRDLGRGRAAVTEAVEAAGGAAVAVASPVLVGDDVDEVTPQPRYRRIREEYGELARTSLACAMHVHVDVESDEEGVRVLDGIRPWLPVILALSANSPYTYGRDTGYASWRSQVWGRWPSHGTREAFGSAAEYAAVGRQLVEWGAALDAGMLYFDARLSQELPTVEVRVADVCTDLEDAALVAALVRGLVATVAEAPAAEAATPWRTDLLHAAYWRASRYGVSERLVHPGERRLVPAREAVAALVGVSRDALEEAGDLERVEELTERLLSRGNGATRQRRTFESRGSLEAVVEDLVARTQESASEPGRVRA